jgi:hypothetical protein
MLWPSTHAQLHIPYFQLDAQLTLGTFHYLLIGISDFLQKMEHGTFPVLLVKALYKNVGGTNDYCTRFKMNNFGPC